MKNVGIALLALAVVGLCLFFFNYSPKGEELEKIETTIRYGLTSYDSDILRLQEERIFRRNLGAVVFACGFFAGVVFFAVGSLQKSEQRNS